MKPDKGQVRNVHAIIMCLRDEGVADADVIGVIQAALLIVAFTSIETEKVREMRRSLEDALDRPIPPGPISPLARWLRMSGPTKARQFVEITWEQWEQSGLEGEALFELFWAAIETAAGERLLTAFEAEREDG